MKTRILSTLFTLVVAFVAFSGCGYERVPQGYTGIEAKNFGGERGGIEEHTAGGVFYNPFTTDFYFNPNFVQTIAWTEGQDPAQGSRNDEAFHILSGDQLEFTIDLGISYYINPKTGCSAEIFRSYRKPIEDITDGVVRMTVRDQMQNIFSQYDADNIYGSGRPEVLSKVTTAVRQSLSDLVSVDNESCFIVDDVYLMRLDPPASVKAAVNKKIEQTQRAQQAVEETKTIREQAEQARIRAEMEALNNRQLSESLTDRVLRNKFLDKWDGKMPQVMSDEGAQLLLNMGN